MLILFLVGSTVEAGSKKQQGDQLYQQAKKAYYSLLYSKNKRSHRDEWIAVIRRFQEVLDQYPGTPLAYKATYTIGRLFHRMAEELGESTDFNSASQYYSKLLSGFKNGNLSDDALLHLGNLYVQTKDFNQARNAFQKVLGEYPEGDQVKIAKNRLKDLSWLVRKLGSPKKPHKAKVPPGTLEVVAHTNSPQKTRIVVEAGNPVQFKEKHLSGPRRIYFDFRGAGWGKGVPEAIVLRKGLASKIRFNRKAERARMVVEIASTEKLKIQTRKLQNQLIIEIFPYGSKGRPAQLQAEKGSTSDSGPAREKPVKVHTFNNKRPVVVVDAGHGGKDDGAHGNHGLLEKHVNLKIARRVAKILEKRYKFNVILTRTDDTFIELRERGEIANRNHADLFVSIHANAAPRKSARGIETYYLGAGSTDQALETAARENGELVHSVSDNDVQEILASLISTTKINDSSRLAATVQKRLSRTMARKFSKVNDLGVKEGPFFVLHDTNMPSILVEVGFVTNSSEEKRLKNAQYQYWLAECIAQGIHDFLKQKAPAI